jgi:hypothetical protein
VSRLHTVVPSPVLTILFRFNLDWEKIAQDSPPSASGNVPCYKESNVSLEAAIDITLDCVPIELSVRVRFGHELGFSDRPVADTENISTNVL